VRLRPDDLDLVARLAQLRLDDSERAALMPQLDRILEYLSLLDQVDVSGIEGTSHPVSLACPVREDREAPSLPPDEAVRGAPETRDGMFAVPRIIG
jgi:aspartyl-tRNA(Asn)/glutamyl-tRNA(Gln) amidotransferase subunit C